MPSTSGCFFDRGRGAGTGYFLYNTGMTKISVKKWLFLPLLCLCVLAASCGKKKGETVPLSGEPSDMSEYILLADQEHVFYDLDVETMVKAMKDKKTFVAYFGYAECEWCAEAAPVLNQAAIESGMEVGYVNTRSNPLWEKNTEIDHYDLLVENVGEYLEYDSDGIRHLYTPTVFFIREGKVVGFHEGTVPDHNARNRLMTEEEREELLNTYRQLFRLLSNDSAAG